MRHIFRGTFYTTMFGMLNGARLTIHTAITCAENNKMDAKDIVVMKRTEKDLGRLATKIFKEGGFMNKKAEYNERTLRLKIGKKEQECFSVSKAVHLAAKEKCESLQVLGKKEVRLIDLTYVRSI